VLSSDTADARNKALSQLIPVSVTGESINNILQSLSDINYRDAVTQAKSIDNTFSLVVIVGSASALLLFFSVFVLGRLLYISIIKPLRHLQEVTKAVIAGDLTRKANIENQDEIGDLSLGFNLMLAGLSEMNSEVMRSGQELTSSANELLAMVTQQNAGTNEQTSAIHETTSTVNQVRATTEQTNLRARAMSESATRSSTIAEEGQLIVNETITGMGLIRNQVEDIAENILALSEQTQQISEIIASVNDLAEQSNLLALNATVEAARAGEHGRGFAVVANEVRSLAERSKQATTQVRTILNDIQKATNAVVMVTEEGTKGVERGLQLIERTGATISQLNDVIRQNLGSAQQIMAVVQQQNVGVDQVAQAMHNINEVTSQNTAANRQLQQSVENLNMMAGRFLELSQRYQVKNAVDERASRWLKTN
jgi:methyl-accepting chemotaxis protein